MQEPTFTDCRILVIGDIMMDRYIEGGISRISPEAPVPVLRKSASYCRLGGGGNVAANLSALGCRSTLISVCGLDAAGSEIGALLKEKAVDSYLLEDQSRPTVSKTRVLSGQHHLLRIDEEETHPLDAGFGKQMLREFEKSLPGCRAVLLSDYGKGVCTPSVCRSVIRASREKGIPVFVDPKGTDWKKYEGASCITPNLSELSAAAGREVETHADRMEVASRLCRTLALDRILVTLGISGMCLIDAAGKSDSVAARAKAVYDVSGAGDTVVAVLSACRATGMNWRPSMETANLAAGIAVGKVGTEPVYIREIREEIRKVRDGHLSKIFALNSAMSVIDAWRKESETIVFTNGCFDLLHPGHVHLLRKAAGFGSRLVVGLNSDASIRRLKGPARPVLDQNDRSCLLASLADVDMVLVFEEDTPLEMIKALRPDVLVKGADYTKETVVGAEVVVSSGGRLELVDLKDGPGTTGIIEKIGASGC
jgi:D-beta-D-heptose 7-phosphate kinase/D-beta-D-heptose 1-phosphate adenosyltransferase